jgi:hypothetical protein
MRDVLYETGNPGVAWGDIRLLDMCAARCTHTSLMEKLPAARHTRILNALDRSRLFSKSYNITHIWIGRGWQERTVRVFTLVEQS